MEPGHSGIVVNMCSFVKPPSRLNFNCGGGGGGGEGERDLDRERDLESKTATGTEMEGGGSAGVSRQHQDPAVTKFESFCTLFDSMKRTDEHSFSSKSEP